MHLIITGLLLTTNPQPLNANKATIVTKVDALKSFASQVEAVVRSGGLELVGASVTRELGQEIVPQGFFVRRMY